MSSSAKGTPLPPYYDYPPTQPDSSEYRPAPPTYFNTPGPAAQPQHQQYYPQPQQPSRAAAQYNTPPQPYAPQRQQYSSNNVVIVNQPTVGYVVARRPRPADNYMTLSIIMTVICFISGNWVALLCTIPAIFFSSMAQDAEKRGDHATANSHARVAIALNITSVVFWIVVVIVAVGSAVIPFALAVNSNVDDSFDNDCQTYTYTDYYDSCK